jgi:phosphoglucomutase
VTERSIAARRRSAYRILEAQDVDLSDPGRDALGGMEVEVVDPVADYADLMARCSTSRRSARSSKGGFTMRFDAMHAVTGPYAKAILERRTGRAAGQRGERDAAAGLRRRASRPEPDLGQGADGADDGPPDAPDFGAASDGDGDRNMILGRGVYVTPSDSLAVLAANAHLAPGYAGG